VAASDRRTLALEVWDRCGFLKAHERYAADRTDIVTIVTCVTPRQSAVMQVTHVTQEFFRVLRWSGLLVTHIELCRRLHKASEGAVASDVTPRLFRHAVAIATHGWRSHAGCSCAKRLVGLIMETTPQTEPKVQHVRTLGRPCVGMAGEVEAHR
jgi:hypothetical protein